MNAAELKTELALGYTDYEILYKGKRGSICPYNMSDGSFRVNVVFDNHYSEYYNLDELMNAPFLDGQTLAECADEIELYG